MVGPGRVLVLSVKRKLSVWTVSNAPAAKMSSALFEGLLRISWACTKAVVV